MRMNAATRKKLFDALYEGAEEKADGDAFAIRLFTESTNEDLDKLAPVIDRLLYDRHTELLTPMACGHPTACLQLAAWATQPKIPAAKEGFFVVDASSLKYECSMCEQKKQFVRSVVEHIKKIFTRGGPFTPTPADVERELA